MHPKAKAQYIKDLTEIAENLLDPKGQMKIPLWKEGYGSFVLSDRHTDMLRTLVLALYQTEG